MGLSPFENLTADGRLNRLDELEQRGIRTKEAHTIYNYDSKFKLLENNEIEIKLYWDSIEKNKIGYEELTPVHCSSSIDGQLSETRDTFLSSIPCDSELGTALENAKNKGRVKSNECGVIRADSLSRTREKLIDYACMHESEWKSFITLTIAENDVSIDEANKQFSDFIRCWRRSFPDLIYLGVPEFQKRGAIHYHILTNVPCGHDLIPAQPKKRIWSTKYKKHYDFIYYDIKHWKKGFTTAFDFKCADDRFNVALYITKYLYKDIDNRLFGRNKILKSNNLKKPDIFELSHRSACYINAMEFIKEKGYSVQQRSFEASKPFQIPFDVLKLKVSRDDYNMLQAILKDDLPF